MTFARSMGESCTALVWCQSRNELLPPLTRAKPAAVPQSPGFACEPIMRHPLRPGFISTHQADTAWQRLVSLPHRTTTPTAPVHAILMPWCPAVHCLHCHPRRSLAPHRPLLTLSHVTNACLRLPTPARARMRACGCRAPTPPTAVVSRAPLCVFL
jgi:hypothetical protein